MPKFENSFSGININKNLNKEELIRAIRFFIAAEYETIQMYNQVAQATNDKKIAKLLMKMADEEYAHVEEFLALLKYLDKNEEEFYESDKKEVKYRFSSNQIKKALHEYFEINAAAEASHPSLRDSLINNYREITEKLKQGWIYDGSGRLTKDNGVIAVSNKNLTATLSANEILKQINTYIDELSRNKNKIFEEKNIPENFLDQLIHLLKKLSTLFIKEGVYSRNYMIEDLLKKIKKWDTFSKTEYGYSFLISTKYTSTTLLHILHEATLYLYTPTFKDTIINKNTNKLAYDTMTSKASKKTFKDYIGGESNEC